MSSGTTDLNSAWSGRRMRIVGEPPDSGDGLTRRRLELSSDPGVVSRAMPIDGAASDAITPAARRHSRTLMAVIAWPGDSNGVLGPVGERCPGNVGVSAVHRRDVVAIAGAIEQPPHRLHVRTAD